MPTKFSPIKRAWLILTFPFRLIYLIVSAPFKIAYLIIKDLVKRPRNRAKPKKVEEVDFLAIGKLLYGEFASEFETYYNSFAKDGEQFYKKFQPILNSSTNLSPLQVLHLFGEYKQKIILMDSRGEENEYELEEYIELEIGQKVDWMNAHLLRDSVAEELQRDGKFILQLFKAIDKDLQPTNKRLLFFHTGSDAYALMPVETATFNKILGDAAGYFEGANDLY